ncbi:MAG: excinuclease ABC subunit UvrC [Lentimicrobiaceae bacterium]|nr:excinuclease ABC subunit UvrC [Lentimicrobiaceae bacterium]
MNENQHKPSEREKHLKQLLAAIPHNPGVYQYFDEKGTIIYIGKAKNLKKRVSSYFNKNQSGKLLMLTRRIHNIQFIVVETEQDALLLENNLIKQYQPRYNILLKDDKTYPWICIKHENFPRIFPIRRIVRDGSEYLGPYASIRTMNTLLELIRQLYPIRTCKHNLTPENIKAKKYKLCLEYHIGNCKGPCQGLQSKEEYDQMIQEIRDIVKGNLQTVLRQLRDRMMRFAETMEFEKAQAVKEKREILEHYRSKSAVVHSSIHNVDVFSTEDTGTCVYVNYLKVIEGAIVQSHTVEMKRKLEESETELFATAIVEIRQRFLSNATEIIVPFEPEFKLENVCFTIPRKGDKRTLLDLSIRNAKHFRIEIEKRRNLVDPERHQKRILNQMKDDLRMPVLPEVIECFDNSNFQGDYAVAAMVQFVNAKPNKNGYRHFNIKTVSGPDDFASMEEIIFRRYQRLLNENKPLPQLIVIDGGKGQLGAALKSLEKLQLRGKITIIGIAKRLEEIYFPDDSIPLYIDKRSETLKIIQQLRDEAHRFGITHHRKKFEKGLIRTELSDIKGIGKQTSQKLLLELKSVKKIKEATFEEIASVIGKAKAKIVYDFYHNNDATPDSLSR